MDFVTIQQAKQCSFLWITILIISCAIDSGVHGLQGVPTWICLGIKSPFIEFQSEWEVLSNASISLNETDKNGASKKGGIHNMAPFSYSLDMVYSNTSNFPDTSSTENPVVLAAMNSKKEVTLIEVKDDENARAIDHVDRKYIIPLALKTPTTQSPRKSQLFQDSSTNIDDLKRHILMLQNLTKNDENFQSKFVVFPNLQRPAAATTTTEATTTTATTTTTTAATTTIGTTTHASIRATPRSRLSLNVPKDVWSEDGRGTEKITIVPQVFLQNDQTPMNDDSFERPSWSDNRKSQRQNGNRYSGNARRQNMRKNSNTESKPSFLFTTKKPAKDRQRQESDNMMNSAGGRKNKQKNNRRSDEKQLRRQMRKACKQQTLAEKQNCIRSIDSKIIMSRNGNVNSTNSSSKYDNENRRIAPISPNIVNNTGDFGYDTNGSRFNNHTKIASRQHMSINTEQNGNTGNDTRDNLDSFAEWKSLVPRTMRNTRHIRRNASAVSRDYLYATGGGSTVSATGSNHSTETTAGSYKEPIDLNPQLCYKVGGLSYGQQKLCVQNTMIMPAISRGARSAIQECRHQFKNRRWNCSTVDDDTVFGPMSGIGSPEMAFIHAITAAGAASFIARACRDGQLASCGCSRSSRPRQLHDDWTWGGCGDDLEFGYKFSQLFIDIRERERKRLQRGLVSIPPKYPKINEKILSDVNDTDVNAGSVINRDENPTGFKPEHLLELQEKITKEILSTKLKESEMQELQAKINHEILNSKVFNMEYQGFGKKGSGNRFKSSASSKARTMMNLHNNEAGRRAVIKKSRITCKCHGVSGSCSLITCWQQLTSMREIGDYLREKYDEATQVKLNKRGRLQVKDPRYKVPSASDLVYLDESPDWCRNNRQLQWPGTHNRVCNKTSTGLDGCAILCCGRGYNTKKIVVKERCNCKFQWCCQVKCETCVRVIEEHSCK